MKKENKNVECVIVPLSVHPLEDLGIRRQIFIEGEPSFLEQTIKLFLSLFKKT